MAIYQQYFLCDIYRENLKKPLNPTDLKRIPNRLRTDYFDKGRHRADNLEMKGIRRLIIRENNIRATVGKNLRGVSISNKTAGNVKPIEGCLLSVNVEQCYLKLF
jgi:hypothetical protein